MAVGNLKKSERKYQSEVEEFIPYAAHYDEDTIITKNGELMEVIKITGFNFETLREGDDNISPLRAIIRETIMKHVESDEVAVWIHTMRRKRDISPSGEFEEGFCKDLHNKWVEKNGWDKQYVNELYITFLGEGENINITDPRVLARSLTPEKELGKRYEALVRSAKKLDTVTRKVMKDLTKFGAKKLTVYQKGGVYYSEILGFISKLMNMKEMELPLEPIDLSLLLPTNKVVFQYNVVQVEEKEQKHYGAILSVKEYQEVTVSEIDKFLQLPVQFMVSQAFNFVSKKEAVAALEDQKKIYDLSGSKFMADISGVSELISGSDKSTEYGQHQIIITVLEDTVKDMQRALSVVVDSLRELGVVFVREDLFLEDCYWSQLPGNFDFLRRQTYIPTNKLGGYASLHNFPAGKMKDNHWGNAVTVLRTAHNTPYFFNFHFGSNGNTALIGPYGTGKTVLLNFLVSEAQKFKGRTFYFEQNNGSEIFIQASGGKYNKLNTQIDQGKSYLNPLHLPDTPENRDFLIEWLEYLVEFVDEAGQAIETYRPISLEDLNMIKKAVELNYQSPKEERMLSFLIPKVWGSDKQVSNTAKRLGHWYMDGKFAKYFDSGIDNLDVKSRGINGFDLTKIMQNNSIAIPMISYLLHRVEESLDKDTPTIIVLDEAWSLIDNPAFMPRLESWLDRITQKNAMIIFATEAPEKAASSSISVKLMNLLATKIFLPNPNATEDYKKVFGLNEKEYQVIKALDNKNHQFLLKRADDEMVCKLSLDGMTKELAVLSASEEKIKIADMAIKAKGNKPVNWLPEYYNLISAQNS